MKKITGTIALFIILFTTSCIKKDKENLVGGSWQRVNVNALGNFNLTFFENGDVTYEHIEAGVTSTGTWSAKATPLYHYLTIEGTTDAYPYFSINHRWNIIRLKPELLIISTDQSKENPGQFIFDFVRQ